MVREACQLYMRGLTICPLGKRDAQDMRGTDSILPEGFIEVAYTEQQQRIRVLALNAVILLHQRGLGVILSAGQGGLW